MALFLVWVKAAYAWCKGHLATVAVAVMSLIGFLLGFSLKKTPVLVQGNDPTKTKAEQQTTAADAKAEAKEQEEIQQAEDTEVSAQKQVVTQEETQTQTAEDSVNQTNEVLINVAKEIEGGDDTSGGAQGGSGS